MPRYWQAARLYSYKLALTQPLNFAGKWLNQRSGLVLELTSSKGTSHWGEAAPLPGFSRESLVQAKTQLFSHLPLLLKQPVLTQSKLLQTEDYRFRELYPSVAFALSCALSSFPLRWPITNSTRLLQGEPEHIWSAWRNANDLHKRSIKLKVARYQPEAELTLIHRLVKHTPNIKLHLDANQGWSLEQAVAFARQLPKGKIRYIEEPIKTSCSHQAELEQFYQLTGQGFALDETVQNIGYQFTSLPGLAMLVIKPSLIGSLASCCQLITQAKKKGIASCISASFESDVALAQLNALALQQTPNEGPGLDTLSYFKESLLLNGQVDRSKLVLEAELS